jgi:Arc-like DNA binding domain
MEQNATTGRVQVHAHVEPEVRAELAAVARVNDRSLAAEIRQAIAEHVSKESAPAGDSTFSAVRSSAPSERGEACASQLAGIRPSPGAPDVPGPAPRPGGKQPPSAQGDYLVQQDQAQERE